MKESQFADALRRQTECIRVSPDLRRQTIDAAYGKEKIIMKRKLPIAALATILSLLLCAAALAAAGQLGLTDYFSSHTGVTIPEGMNEFLKTDVMSFEDENFTVSVRELLYDGQTAHLAVNVTPKADKTMLLGADSVLSDPWSDLTRLMSDHDPDDGRTLQQVFDEEGYEAAFRVGARLKSADETDYSTTGDCYLNEDGSMTYFVTTEFADNQPERQAKLMLTYKNLPAGDNPEYILIGMAFDKELTLTTNAQEEVFVSAEPVKMEDVGITIDQLQMRATPIGLYGTIYYTIDGELPAGVSAGDLLLTLIDPAIETDKPYMQALKPGLIGGSYGCRLTAEGETPERYVMYCSLDPSELRDSYTIRACNPFTEAKTYYQPVTLTMKPAAETDTLMTAD